MRSRRQPEGTDRGAACADAFVVDESPETTVDLDGHRAASDLDELELDEEPDAGAA